MSMAQVGKDITKTKQFIETLEKRSAKLTVLQSDMKTEKLSDIVNKSPTPSLDETIDWTAMVLNTDAKVCLITMGYAAVNSLFSWSFQN